MSIRYIITALMATLVLFASSCADTRQPARAGSFYPSDPAELRQMVEEHLQRATGLPEIEGQIIALIVPHAGLVYSGPIAACSYKLLENSQVNEVVLCGPSHAYGFEGVSVYGPGVAWRSPLGTVACDDDLCQQLVDFDPRIDVIPAAHSQEHCLEVQLPYLQTVLDDFRIVPAIMGYPNAGTVELLVDALGSLPWNEQKVMVASTDWQHYKSAAVGWRLDSLGLDCIKNLDADRLLQGLSQGKVEACGGAAAAAVMKAAVAKGANRAKILKYGDSGDVSGDKSAVVGYVAAVLYKSADGSAGAVGSEPQSEPQASDLPDKFELNSADRARLLQIARESIAAYLESGKIPEFEASSNLRQPGAAFVTLEKQGQLRGCIGYTEAIMPLNQTVAECAVKAAVADRRFPPVQRVELDSLHIEISVLTPLQVVKSLDDIEVGRDGLMIFKGPYRGLLLPQVATDYGWGREEFLMQTCRKAGLPPEAYKSPGATIYRFQAVIFSEPESH